MLSIASLRAPLHKHSVLTQRVASRMGLTRQSFLPYTREQLGTILRQRVQGMA
jgi:Cdc6-like AAA superfamily ATPase